MSRMQTPELEVIRFTEEDVIAASGAPNTMSFHNFNNPTNGDGYIRYMGVNYYTNPTGDQKDASTDLINALIAQGYTNATLTQGDLFSATGTSTNTLQHLIELDTTDTSKPTGVDGTYVWDNNSTFSHQ